MVVAALLALATVAPVEPPATLERLARAASAEILRAAGERPIEMLTPEDRVGDGTAAALFPLVRARIAEAGRLASRGPRVRVVSVVSAGPLRIRLSGRLLLEPGGRTLDLFSVGVARAAGDGHPGPGADRVAWRGPLLDAPVPSGVLALALLDGDRALLVRADHVSLVAWTGAREVRESARLPLAVEWPVRAPGALVSCEAAGCWVLTSHMGEAVLVTAEEAALVEVARAAVAPWPGAPGGVRFRAGTNLLEADLAALPGGPYLALGAGPRPFAVSPDGALGIAGRGWTAARSGSVVAPLGPGTALLTSARPPGAADELRVVGLDADPPREDGALRLAGAIRAVAVRDDLSPARVGLIVDDHTGGARLVVYELAPATAAGR